MSAKEILEQIRQLPPEEQYEVVEKIREEFATDEHALTPEQIVELERRAEELRKYTERGIHWERVQAELHERLKSREG